jgi:histidine triad (HIT) family protein
MDTIFQKIIDRTVPAEVIYEDAVVLAFLDINPIRKGHTLIIPKHPYVDIFDMDPEVLGHMARVAQKIARALMHSLHAHGVNLHMNNGQEAGQDVFHAHLHVIPRLTRDEAFLNPQHESYADGEASRTAAELRLVLQTAA